MSEQEYTETIEPPEEFEPELEAPEASYHTILEVWREILAPIDEERSKPISMEWANRIVAGYNEVAFADLPHFLERYFDLLEQLRQVVVDVIGTDGDSLSYDKPEDDARENRQHYKDCLFEWQRIFILREQAWSPVSTHPGADLAAIAEAHKMFFGPTGLTQYLDNIGFQFDEADQEEMRQAIEDVKEGR